MRSNTSNTSQTKDSRPSSPTEPEEQHSTHQPESPTGFEGYKLLVEDTARFLDRRQALISTYFGINVAIITAFGAITGFITFLFKDAKSFDWQVLLAVTPLLLCGMVVCLLWRLLVKEHGWVIRHRYHLLEKMEQDTPGLPGVYTSEWGAFYTRPFYRGQEMGFLSIAPSELDGILPVLFLTIYLVIAVLLIVLGVTRVL